MALNPKLNIYVLTLNPKDKDSNLVFRDLFKNKYHSEGDDKTLQKLFFEDFLNNVGKQKFRIDIKSKKVIGVSEYNVVKGTSSLNLHSDKNIIDGIIDGGPFGISRFYANIKNKSDKKEFDSNLAILDKFYICLCTPINSAVGFLFIQSYTESSIQEPIKNFISDTLECNDKFYAIITEPYVPKDFVEKFKKEAKIKMFTYHSKIGISDVMRDNKIILKGQAFNVDIKITPLENEFSPDSKEVETLSSELGKKNFDNFKLSDVNEKTVYIQDGKEHKAHYNVTKELKSIRPTIYLKDQGVSIDEATGQPDFEDIKKFTLSLLENVKTEYNNDGNIEEL